MKSRYSPGLPPGVNAESTPYGVTVTFASEAGNEFQGASSTLDFTWDATSG